MIGEPQSFQHYSEHGVLNLIGGKDSILEYNSQKKEKEDQIPSKLFVIEGNIGVGKTTLARSLAKKMRCKPFLEPALENPFLERFYDDPHKYAMKLQMWIFRQRYRTFMEAVRHMDKTGEGVILDRSVFSDYVFARVGYNQGFISEEDFLHYQLLRQRVVSSLPKPFCVIYLAASPEMCSERLMKRGRECESTIPLDYLQCLDSEYQSLLVSFQAERTPVVHYDWSQFGSAEDVMKKMTVNVTGSDTWKSDHYQRAYDNEGELLTLLNKASEDADHRT